MGCASKVTIGRTLNFSICTHNPEEWGEAWDADALPLYRVYDDDNDTLLLSGEMAVADVDNTTGYYSAFIDCTTANGFVADTTYNIYIEATVAGHTGAISYSFIVESPLAGPGEDRVTLDFELPDDSPIADADVWITSDAAGDIVVAGTSQTDSDGRVTFMLKHGNVYYVWLQKDGVNPILGQAFTAQRD